MAWSTDYECSRCHQAFSVHLNLFTYVASPTNEQAGFSEPGWCYDCEELCEIESLPPLERFERILQEHIEGAWDTYIHRDSELHGLSFEVQRANAIRDWELACQWRVNRKSPARCMECESVNVEAVENPGEFLHPDCGGILQSQGSAHLIVFGIRRLTPEGTSYWRDCFKRAALFVAESVAVPIAQLNDRTYLESDLGLTGEHAIRFISEFAEEFKVDISNFVYLNHFRPAISGGSPVTRTIRRLHRNLGIALDAPHPISIRMLAGAIFQGRWRP